MHNRVDRCDSRFLPFRALTALAFAMGFFGAVAAFADPVFLPRIDAVTVTAPAPTSPGTTLTLSFGYHLSGLLGTKAEFVFNNGATNRMLTAGSNDLFSHRVSGAVGADWPNGTYKLQTIIVSTGADISYYDAAGNLLYTTAPWLIPMPGAVVDSTGASFTISGSTVGSTALALTAVSRTSADNLIAGNAATFAVNATIALEPTQAGIVLKSPDGSVSANANLVGASGSISIPTAPEWTNGLYTVEYVYLDDMYNSLTYQTGSPLLPQTLSFQFSGGVDNAVWPKLASISRQSAGFSGAMYSYAAAAGTSAIVSTLFELTDSSGYTHQYWGNGTSAQVYPAQDSVSDTYQLSRVILTDAVGRTATYYRDGTLDLGKPPPARHPFDFSTLDCAVVGWNPSPAILTQPVGDMVLLGHSMTLNIAAYTPQGGTYQWYAGQSGDTTNPIAGATAAQFTPPPISATKTYWCRVTATGGTADSAGATLTATGSRPARLVNVSVRANAGTGDQSLTVGFYVNGSVGKKILVRGIGPTLGALGIGNYLPNPEITLFRSGSTAFASNNGWDGSAAMAAVFRSVGAFDIVANSGDAALVQILNPGGYSAEVTSTTGSGIALLEAYDADGALSSEFSNLSVRSVAGTGNAVLTGGFVIDGDGSRTVLIRAIGPSLVPYGVSDFLADPQLTVFRGSTVIAQNNDWGGDPTLTATFKQVGAFPLAPSSLDSALLVTLGPGNYTAQVSGAGAASGVALLEVYALPAAP